MKKTCPYAEMEAKEHKRMKKMKKKPEKKKHIKKIIKHTKKHVTKAVSKGEKKIEKVMHEYKEGALHSGSKKGPKVTNKKQAIAIALSEARKKGAHIPKKK